MGFANRPIQLFLRWDENRDYRNVARVISASDSWGIDSIFGNPAKSALKLGEDDAPSSCREANTPGLLFRQ